MTEHKTNSPTPKAARSSFFGTWRRKFLNFWFSKTRDGFYVFLCILVAGLYVTALGIEEYQTGTSLTPLASMLKAIAFIGILLLACLVLVHLNLHALHNFLKLFGNADHLPQKQIAHVNSFCMTVFLGITLTAMVSIATLADPLWHKLVAWFRSIWEPIPPEPLAPEETLMNPGMMAPDLSQLVGEQTPPPAWMEYVNKFFEFLGYVLVILVFLFLIRAALRAVWSWITKPRHFDDDEKIYLKPVFSLAPEETPDKAPASERGLRYFLSYNGKIRRRYRKEILTRYKKSARQTPPEWASPTELEAGADIRDVTLHKLYEKARYSQTECTEDDWKALSEKSK